MRRSSARALVFVSALSVLVNDASLFGRGGGRAGGGGMRGGAGGGGGLPGGGLPAGGSPGGGGGGFRGGVAGGGGGAYRGGTGGGRVGGVSRPSTPAFRGHIGGPVPQLGSLGQGGRPGIGDRPGVGNHPGRSGDGFPNAGDRLPNAGGGPGNRGDRINNRRDFWQDVHNDWYHGYWNGHWRQGAGYWYQHPWAEWGVTADVMGLTSWEDGSLFYDTGYYEYENPYYAPTAAGEPSAVDYSQPIVTTAAVPELASPTLTASRTEVDQAREAFYQKDYTRALALADAALAKTPGDVVLHEFRALVLFALQRYKEAAGTLYAVLSVGPGWDWTTMSSLYANRVTYADELRALEDHVQVNPDSPDGHFVLAYHYLAAGQQTYSAARQFEEVVRRVPSDQVSRQLLAMIAPSAARPEDRVPETSRTAGAEPGPAAPLNLIGKWKAHTAARVRIDLALAEDGRFRWTYARPGKTNSFDGKHKRAGATLVLEYDNGGTMVGKVTAEGPNRFSFKMIGVAKRDPGLVFEQVGT
jgi:tetratricopeptide (TPR) repeat protein